MSAALVVMAACFPMDTSASLQKQAASAAKERASVYEISSGTAFYRKYTEALLRRYMQTSFDMGKSPSILGNLTFRGKSSHSSRRGLEDAVIFVHDVDTCLKKLDSLERHLLARIALQEYTQAEVAQMLGTSVRSVMRRYCEALDRLTEILLEVDLLDPTQC